ncbi:hypothetical protein ACFY5K_25745 [Streptomyces griseofuscus]|uniref:hypothetical protein n=1 Tax=Streptomyces griseofuscus TaxID=146922 RepID=UPI0036755AEF
MHDEDQAQDGPRMRDAAEPARAEAKRSWRQAALWELDDLADLYPDLPGVRL